MQYGILIPYCLIRKRYFFAENRLTRSVYMALFQREVALILPQNFSLTGRNFSKNQTSCENVKSNELDFAKRRDRIP
jgi:hypothetical protein